MSFFENKEIELNSIEKACLARREQNLSLIDLTCSNPTLQNYLFPEQVLRDAAAQYFSSRVYEPASKGMLVARECIAKYYKARGLNISAEHIIITANTSEAYTFLFSLLCAAGDNVLAPNITYPLFDFLAEHQKINLKQYIFNEENNVWDIDYSSVAKAADARSKALMIISPHNPLGHLIKERANEVLNLQLPIICDEVFSEFAFDAKNKKPVGCIYSELPVFHLNGISKMFALPDMKLGWIAMNDVACARYAERLELLNDMFLSASSFIQFALPEIFKAGENFQTEMLQDIKEKVELAARLINSSKHFRTAVPHGGYYLFPKIVDLDLSEDEVVLELIRRGVLVHPGYFYGENWEGDGSFCEGAGLGQGSGHIMLSCLVKREELLAGVKKIVEM